MSTKIDIINGAYSQMRISGLTVNPEPEDVTLALRRLEAMMARYEGRNVCLNYNFEETPDPNSPTGVTLTHEYMLETNLAVLLIPDFNKQVPTILINLASAAFSESSGIVAAKNIREVQPPSRQPRGSGNMRFNRYRRYYRNAELPPNNCETEGIVVDDVQDYQESFKAYLGDETMVSVLIEVSDGLTLVSSSGITNDPIVDYRIQADTASAYQKVKFTLTTSTGRIDTRIINFQVFDDTGTP